MDSRDAEFHEHYVVYGLSICSNHPMPELVLDTDSNPTMDLKIWVEEAGLKDVFGDEKLLTSRTTNLGVDLTASESKEWLHLRWQSACEFHIRKDGSRVLGVVKDSRVEPSWLNSLFYGVVLSYVLHVRGSLNLHAGAVKASNGVVGILAEAGTGKSTLTAHLSKSGLGFVTDDILVPSLTDDGYLVSPGFPFVSLTAESIESVFGPGLVPHGMKRGDVNVKERIEVDGKWAQFVDRPAHLHSLIVMSRSNTSSYQLNQLDRQEAVLSLIRHSVAMALLPRNLVAKHMDAASRLVQYVPVWNLRVPAGLTNVPRTAELINKRLHD